MGRDGDRTVLEREIVVVAGETVVMIVDETPPSPHAQLPFAVDAQAPEQEPEPRTTDLVADAPGRVRCRRVAGISSPTAGSALLATSLLTFSIGRARYGRILDTCSDGCTEDRIDRLYAEDGLDALRNASIATVSLGTLGNFRHDGTIRSRAIDGGSTATLASGLSGPLDVFYYVPAWEYGTSTLGDSRSRLDHDARPGVRGQLGALRIRLRDLGEQLHPTTRPRRRRPLPLPVHDLGRRRRSRVLGGGSRRVPDPLLPPERLDRQPIDPRRRIRRHDGVADGWARSRRRVSPRTSSTRTS